MINWDELEKPSELKAVANSTGDGFDDHLTKMKEYESAIGHKAKKLPKNIVDRAWKQYQRRLKSEKIK